MPKKPQQLAKLTRPRLHNAVARERLFALLDGAREHKPAICVVGPPGAGKTTLVASWLDARKIPGIWYQVDAGDADLATFFYYLGEAAKPFTRKGQRPLPLLTPEYLQDVEGFSRRFFRDLFARIPDGATFVLDNYQEVGPEQPFHQVIAQAIDEVPESATLVAVSRRDPPDCYTRLIANQNVAFVDWGDLKLELDETRVISRTRKQLSERAVRELHELCGGWAAGLVLMLEHANDNLEPTDKAVESREALFRYFTALVFDRLPDEIQHFLMTTSVLREVTPPIAEQLTGNLAASLILEELYHRHLFVHRKPGLSSVYQYHALFKEFLLRRAELRLGKQAMKDLRCMAARLLAGERQPETAVDLVIEAEEWDEAVRLMIELAPQLIAKGRWQSLHLWLDRLPAEKIERSPWLMYWRGRSKLGVDTLAGRQELICALHAFADASDVAGQVLSVTGIIESYWLEWSGYRVLDDWIDRLLNMLKCDPIFPDAETQLRTHTVLLLALSWRKPEAALLKAVQERVKEQLNAKHDDETRLLAGSILVGHSLPVLDLALARWTMHAIGELPESGAVSALTRINWFIRLSYHFAQSGDYEGGMELVARAEALAEAEGLRVGLANRCFWGGYVNLLSGNPRQSLVYAQLLEASPGLVHSFQHGVVFNIRCAAFLALGDITLAVEYGRRAIEIANGDSPAWSRPYFTIPAVYALIENGSLEEAHRHIDSLRAFLKGTFIDIHEVELDLAVTYALLKEQGRGPQFLDALRGAMRLARERSYIFSWRSCFRAHQVLFREAFRAGIEISFLRETVARFRILPGAEADEWWPWQVRVYTLGRFEVLVGDKPLAFGQKVPRRLTALLKALVALGGREVPEHKVLDLLWPDEEGDAAHHALTVAIHRLRRLLGSAECIRVEDGALTLVRTRVWVDAFDAMAAMFAGLEAAKNGSAAIPEDTIHTVTSLYQGVFLPADNDAAWSVSFRERLRAAFVDFVSTHGRFLETQGAWKDAAHWYQRGLAADDLSESFYQGLMRCHLRLGRHAEGLNTFHRMRQALFTSLGIHPSPASEALYRTIQAHR